MTNLPCRLREHRRAANLSQIQLAERSYVSLRTIIRIERGYDRASKATVKLLADALNTTVEKLVDDEGEAA